MIGECRNIKRWKDINGVSPRPENTIIRYTSYGAVLCKIIGFNNRSNLQRILLKEYKSGTDYYRSLYMENMDTIEVISKYHPKYKEF